MDLSEMIRKNIDHILRERNLRRKDLANLTGLGAASISHYMSGKRAITLQTLELICRGLIVNPEVMFRPLWNERFPITRGIIKAVLKAVETAKDLRRSVGLIDIPGIQDLALNDKLWEEIAPTADEVSAILALPGEVVSVDLPHVVVFILWWREVVRLAKAENSTYKRLTPQKEDSWDLVEGGGTEPGGD